MRYRHELTDAQWQRIAPLLPRPRRGPQPRDRRRLLNGILWLHATGVQWRDLPERYGPWQTVASQFYRWVRSGVWDTILAALQQQGDAAGKLDWSAHFVDGTVVRAHQRARLLDTFGVPTGLQKKQAMENFGNGSHPSVRSQR